MIKGEIIVDDSYKGKNGYAIKIKLYQNRRKKYVSTQLHQSTKKLRITDKVSQKIEELEKQLNHCNDLRMTLDQAKEFIKNNSKTGQDDELEIFLLKKRLAELQSKNSIGILEFFEIRIKELTELGSSTTAYLDTMNQISNFLLKVDVPINSIDYEWLNDFIIYKKKYGKGGGNIPYLLKTLRALYKEAQRRESLNVKRDNPFVGLIKTNPVRETPSFSIQDVKKLFKYDPKKSTTKKSLFVSQRHIDIFLFQIAIGGHDYADIANLNWDNIKEGRIIFKRFKNRNKPNGGETVNNHLSDFALKILDKYGDRSSDKVFSHLPYPSVKKSYTNKRQNANQALGRISNTLGMNNKFTSKAPRYIFRSLAGEQLIDLLVIMQIQGHKPDGVTFKYQRRLPDKIIDKELKKVLDIIF